MNIIKRHKWLALICGLTLILIIIMTIIFARMLFSNGNSEYGQRLDDIVELKKSDMTKIIEENKSFEEVEDITIRTQGKIIYTTITLKAGTKLDKAKEVANNTIKKYDDDVIECYDFEFFLKENVVDNEETEEVETGYTVAGTKHHHNDKISWTK